MTGVVVVGSVNHDVLVRVDRLPGPGETVLATDRAAGLGGKGANQAIAVARTGTTCRLVGAVGDDAAGVSARAVLVDAGVGVDGLSTVAEVATGTAFVLVDDAGENQIVVDPGANDRLALDDEALTIIRSADVLVVQDEVPADVVAEAVAAAEVAGTRIVVNLAPFRPAPQVVALADPLVVNEHEASELLGVPVRGADDVRRHSGPLLTACRSAVVTLGAAGAVLAEDGAVIPVASPAPRRVVDTTGAGDAFVGVLAAGLSRGMGLAAAAEAAAAAGSLSVENRGAGSGYPAFDLPER